MKTRHTLILTLLIVALSIVPVSAGNLRGFQQDVDQAPRARAQQMSDSLAEMLDKVRDRAPRQLDPRVRAPRHLTPVVPDEEVDVVIVYKRMDVMRSIQKFSLGQDRGAPESMTTTLPATSRPA